MDLRQRGDALFAMILAQVIGLFAWGWADKWLGSYKRAGMIGVLASLFMLCWAAAWPPTRSWVIPFLIVYALCFAVTPVLTAHGRALFPPRLLGRGLTLLNIGNMGGVFLQQAVTGLVIEAFGGHIADGVRVYPPEGYRAVFALLAGEMAVAALLYARATDPHLSKIS